jgi:hypothetical protein
MVVVPSTVKRSANRGRITMSLTGIADSTLVEGSLFLTREKVLERGGSFHDVFNAATGEHTELCQRPLGGIAYSLQKAPDGQSGYVACPTVDSLWRMDALQRQVKEDTPAVEQVLAESLEQAGVDPGSAFSMTANYDEDQKTWQIQVGHDHPQWQKIETLFRDNAALRSDVMGIWGQQGVLADMEAVADVLRDHASGGQEAISRAWLGRDNGDPAQPQDAALRYSNGRLLFPA